MKTIKKLILPTRFFTILAILIFTFSSNSIAFAQNTAVAPLTDAEKKEAEEITFQVAIRFSQTKDIRPLLNEFFSDNFIELYKKKSLGDIDTDKNVFLMPGVYAKGQVLKEISIKEWEDIYVSTNNFLFSGVACLIKTALKNKGKVDEDRILEKIYSKRLRTLFDKNPNLVDAIKSKRKAKPISSVDEFKTAIAVLNQGIKIFDEENSISLDEESQKLLKLMIREFSDKTEVNTTDEGEYGLARGTRVIRILSPFMMHFLFLAKKGDKLKVVDTIPYAD